MFKMFFKFLRVPMFIKKDKINRYFWIIRNIYYGEFGRNSLIEKPLMIYNKNKIFIRNNVTIRPNLRIEPIKKWIDVELDPEIHIGSNTNIERNCHITCANRVIIGENVTILGYSCITDIDHEYKDIEKGILQQPLIVKKTVIKDQSFIGMGSRIMVGSNIGKHCVIGANSVVNRDIPDYCVAVGSLSKIIKRYNFDTGLWQKTNENGDFI